MTYEQLTPPGIELDGSAPPDVPASNGDVLISAEDFWLPPTEYLNLPPEKIPTPVDERGLVEISELLEAVKAHVDPEYVWSARRSTHHFYWPEVWYPSFPRREDNPARFRNVPIHKGEVPREFENLLHLITMPPALPSPEVRMYRAEAWRVTRNLFESAREVVQWERRAHRRREIFRHHPSVIDFPENDEIAEQYMAEIINKHFVGVERHMSELERVPPEFRLVEPQNSPRELARVLGQIIVPRSLRLVNAIRSTGPIALAA